MPTHSIAHRFSATAKEKRCSPRTSAHTATGKHSVFRPVRFPSPAPQFCGDLPFGRTHPLAWPLTVFLSIPHHKIYFFANFCLRGSTSCIAQTTAPPSSGTNLFHKLLFYFLRTCLGRLLDFFHASEGNLPRMRCACSRFVRCLHHQVRLHIKTTQKPLSSIRGLQSGKRSIWCEATTQILRKNLATNFRHKYA